VTRSRSANAALQGLLREVRACTICAARLPLPPRPVLQAGVAARLLIRLRAWMGIDKAAFHDPDFIAILPMGFCYPDTGASGDLPPRPECAATWRERLLEQLPSIELTLVIGTYAQAWHLKPAGGGASLTATVAAWREHGARVLPLPHPSPRNNGWLQRNPWFEAEVLPELKARVRALQGR
jgi:uracil-DNA glycosylase